MAVNLKNPEAERLKREQEANRQRQLRAVQELIEEARAAKHSGESTKTLTDELWGA